MTGVNEQVVVVTGASSGIGEAIALGLAAKGANLCLIGRNLKRLNAVAEAARKSTANVFCYRVDLTCDEDISSLKSRLKSDCGRVDALIHGAGVINLGSLESSHIDYFDMQYRVNVRAPYLLTQALLPILKRYQGQIVFINSTVKARANLGPYAATKYALKAVSDSLRDEVNAYRVRVMSVYPGRTATPMQAALCKIEGKRYRPKRLLQAEDVAEVVIHAMSLPRTAEVTDISIRPMMKS
jgi:NADP-dependent 3-hydroxy acid dehydrogenase YdfG